MQSVVHPAKDECLIKKAVKNILTSSQELESEPEALKGSEEEEVPFHTRRLQKHQAHGGAGQPLAGGV